MDLASEIAARFGSDAPTVSSALALHSVSTVHELAEKLAAVEGSLPPGAGREGPKIPAGMKPRV